MKEEDRHIDLFDAYTRNELSSVERETLESRLKHDKDFKSAYEDYQKELMVIEALAVKKKMKYYRENTQASRRVQVRWKYLIPVGFAATLALTLLFLPKKAIDNQTLFQENFKPYPNAITDRAVENSIQEAMDHYKARRYSEAIKVFNSINHSDTVIFYKSLSHLSLNQPKAALSGFDLIETNSRFYRPMLWYKGLNFLLLNNRDSASYYMKRINNNSPNYDAANRILELMKAKKGQN